MLNKASDYCEIAGKLLGTTPQINGANMDAVQSSEGIK